MGESRRFRVQGTDGFLDLEKAFGYHGQRLVLDKIGRTSEIKIEPVDHFATEMDDFSDVILTGRDPRTPGEEGLADMGLIAFIHEAAKSGRALSAKY